MKFVPNPEAPAEIERSKGWAIRAGQLADAVAVEAKAAFEAQGPHPYSDSPEHYADEIDGSVVMERGVIAGRTTAHVSYSWYIEVGTSDTPKFAPLRRGVDAVGLRLEIRHA